MPERRASLEEFIRSAGRASLANGNAARASSLARQRQCRTSLTCRIYNVKITGPASIANAGRASLGAGLIVELLDEPRSPYVNAQ
eukprot:4996881-Pleurochrysis_carterae.AAC.3